MMVWLVMGGRVVIMCGGDGMEVVDARKETDGMR